MNLKKTIIPVLLICMVLVSNEAAAQNQRADGYKGLWSSSLKAPAYGYRFSGGLATYSAQHNPVAIYSGKAKKTFFVYGGTAKAEESNLQIMISYFDHKTGMVPKPVIVYDKMGVNDPQDNATISINSEGYIYVFVSGMGRTRPGFIFRSGKPYSIDKFEKIYDGEIVFPQPWWIHDSCFVMMYTKFMRGGSGLFSSTSCDGKTWSPGEKIAGMGGHSQITNTFGNKVFTAFNYFPGRAIEKQTNLYLLQSEDQGKTWKSIDNKIIQTPLTESHNDALIKDYESEKKLVYIKDLNFDSQGNPAILAIISNNFLPGPSGDPREWMVIHWKDNRWNLSKVCESDHNHDLGSLYISGNEWRIVGPTESGPQKYGTGGEMALWLSPDNGKTWKKEFDITSGSIKNNSFARRPLNYNKKFYSFWADGDADELSESRIYFTDESCKKVWVLPYNMSMDFEKPVRVK